MLEATDHYTLMRQTEILTPQYRTYGTSWHTLQLKDMIKKKSLNPQLNMQYLYNRLVYTQQEKMYTRPTRNFVVVRDTKVGK